MYMLPVAMARSSSDGKYIVYFQFCEWRNFFV